MHDSSARLWPRVVGSSPPRFTGRQVGAHHIWNELDAETWPIVDLDEPVLDVRTRKQQHLIHPVSLPGDGFKEMEPRLFSSIKR